MIQMLKRTNGFKYMFAASLALTSYIGLAQSTQTLTPNQLAQIQSAGATENSNNLPTQDLSEYIQSQDNGLGREQGLVLPSQAYQIDYGQSKAVPFGSNIFNGSFTAKRSDGLNSNYLIAPGDKISIQLWGAIQKSSIITVDSHGNIFIPDIGPVSVENVYASRLNDVVAESIRTIYPQNVNVYVNLLTATPVSVFVTGPVIRPGQYAGLPSDSILYFLNSAGGIDAERGSYRNISVIRNGEVIEQYDLYDFLKQGQLADVSFKDNDLILVGEQGITVNVEGSAKYPLQFELTAEQRDGASLMNFALPLNNASHVAVTGHRNQIPSSIYLNMEKFADFEIDDGDTVLFNEDLRGNSISVKLSGSYEGQSFYTVQKHTRLLDLLNHIEANPIDSNYKNIFIKRQSVAEQQKILLEESLQRLERSIFTAPASSSGEALIRAREAELVAQFIARARQVEPLGKVVVADGIDVANIRLEQGDVIVIPKHTDLVQVSGEVLLPQAIVYNQNANVADYIARAGGFSERADDTKIAIIRVNGIASFTSLNNGMSGLDRLRPGDQILVLPKVDSKVMQAVKDITQIMYQIAITANVAID